MQRIPLAEYAAKRHAGTAEKLGMSQGSLSKAIREGRSIFVIVSDDGRLSALEEKPFPSQRRGNSAQRCTNNNPAGSEFSGSKVPVNPSSNQQASL
ncbi:Cro/CI family transcriptional regulator [Pseudomonas syringae]|uniref:Cro/CI family transcriptional regulator n=1 Tax=Pseudomonas syringae TaxID=317 RepID=UPI001012C7E6|nr:Cro/CI family transcriptional regulator [Pseudomonas syringae]RXT63073.1 Cro/Cl family transcriptional regulator [Pseudomonas syringae]RXT63207.1 Cro/Cl family transcriptional regulator [Pseudomonas syringae]RXT91693.1 Cro/Cl family transcriptional regulator [Pseudomonas syringae]